MGPRGSIFGYFVLDGLRYRGNNGYEVEPFLVSLCSGVVSFCIQYISKYNCKNTKKLDINLPEVKNYDLTRH